MCTRRCCLKGKSWHWASVFQHQEQCAYTSTDKCNSKCKTYMRGEIVQQPSSLNNSLEMLDGQSGYHRLFIMEETPLVTSLSEYLNRSDEQSIFQLKKVTMKRSMVPKVILLVLASFCINTARAIFIAEHRTFAWLEALLGRQAIVILCLTPSSIILLDHIAATWSTARLLALAEFFSENENDFYSQLHRLDSEERQTIAGDLAHGQRVGSGRVFCFFLQQLGIRPCKRGLFLTPKTSFTSSHPPHESASLTRARLVMPQSALRKYAAYVERTLPPLRRRPRRKGLPGAQLSMTSAAILPKHLVSGLRAMLTRWI